MAERDIFSYVAAGGTSGGFVILQKLPGAQPPGRIHCLEIQCAPGLSPLKIASIIIQKLGEKPARPSEQRARQLEKITALAQKEGSSLVFIFKDAHRLPQRTLGNLPSFREICGDPPPGIILEGNIDKIHQKIKTIPRLTQRAATISETGQIAPWLLSI